MKAFDRPPPRPVVDDETWLAMATKSPFNALDQALETGHDSRLWDVVKGTPYEKEYRTRVRGFQESANVSVTPPAKSYPLFPSPLGQMVTVTIKTGPRAGQTVLARRRDGIYYHYNSSTGYDEPIGGEGSVSYKGQVVQDPPPLSAAHQRRNKDYQDSHAGKGPMALPRSPKSESEDHTEWDPAHKDAYLVQAAKKHMPTMTTAEIAGMLQDRYHIPASKARKAALYAASDKDFQTECKKGDYVSGFGFDWQVVIQRPDGTIMARNIADDTHREFTPEEQKQLTVLGMKGFREDQSSRVGQPRKVDGEWVVPVFINGKRDEDKTYYTDDREDAFATFELMKKQLAKLSQENVSIVSKAKALLHELFADTESPESDDVGDDDSNNEDGFHALITHGDNDQAVVKLEKSGRWTERFIAGVKPYGFGGKTYASYLTRDDILSWLQKDYDQVEVIDPDEVQFEVERMKHAEQPTASGEDGYETDSVHGRTANESNRGEGSTDAADRHEKLSKKHSAIAKSMKKSRVREAVADLMGSGFSQDTVDAVVNKVQPFLGDVIDTDSMSDEEQYEEAWTLTCDACQDLDADPQSVGMAAMLQMGYSKDEGESTEGGEVADGGEATGEPPDIELWRIAPEGEQAAARAEWERRYGPSKQVPESAGKKLVNSLTEGDSQAYKEAYKEGHHAGKSGKRRESPLPPGIERDHWFKGYDAGRKERAS